MVGRTLADIRARIDELSVAVGPYRVRSARTGDSPVPVTGKQFPDRETAAEAASVATAYRTALRRYDPYVAVHGLVVSQTTAGSTTATVTQSLPAYCHRVAGALFETLSNRYGRIERRVMDTYLEAAETTENRTRLCLSMLESTATAIDEALPPDEQATVLSAAAGRLPRRSTADRPLRSALTTLRSCDLVRSFSVEPTPDHGESQYRITLAGYRPSLDGDRCPVLPVAVELLRRTGVPPAIVSASRFGDGWRLRVSTVSTVSGSGLAVAPSA
ncbi:DUF7551 domain-containing protein [Haloarcula pellucida]|uniref:Uncharacterized protein n=1 Tax=Haloarcula pellucida TaxID=1427151 RepID=A0A830GH76_9EURY|nr:hypothetical protein [Halomicroarcula pellucida]MBX0347502.1 hypothetical protein [Halomicroarcula pellucida]GGN88983.1 hypothetical protein GCM10009030_09270 [Halomicroarcula pellucida]